MEYILLVDGSKNWRALTEKTKTDQAESGVSRRLTVDMLLDTVQSFQ